jgi:hypothetical protein
MAPVSEAPVRSKSDLLERPAASRRPEELLIKEARPEAASPVACYRRNRCRNRRQCSSCVRPGAERIASRKVRVKAVWQTDAGWLRCMP